MKHVRTFTVHPVLPERLADLRSLTGNLWWCWNHDAVDLFRSVDPTTWDEVEHNPITLLRRVSQERLQELAETEEFLDRLDSVMASREEYLTGRAWFQENHAGEEDMRIAYFSAEYGIHESLPIYSGGLGILAGDHVKSASDLGLPLTAVGLFYRYGYCRQSIGHDGWQRETYQENLPQDLCLQPVETAPGTPLMVTVPFPGRLVHARIWQVAVGRVELFLLDSNLPENTPEDRWITSHLYGGDEEKRVQQEILLGIGGVRALMALDRAPDACHMNEGHSAFLALERIRLLMAERGFTWEEARQASMLGNTFTTHTPVPAGNDTFPPDLLEPYFKEYIKELDIDWDTFLRLGRIDPADGSEDFCMTVLALRLAEGRNGVSRLHGAVSRDMWKEIWPGLPEEEVPIGSITNGIHAASWVGGDLAGLLDRHLGQDWTEAPCRPEVLAATREIPDRELWELHEVARARLVTFVRDRLARQLERYGAPQEEIDRAGQLLDPRALTIGFARRFAAYKRGSLVFRDMERLQAIMARTDRPVQFIFAGKAHPRNETGKEFIRDIVKVARRDDMRATVVFLEDYDINVARHLVQGVDLWLNNPRRPLEASGTSGMKVAANGGPNLSILDGWWCEGYRADLGWAIGNGETYDDLEYQNQVEAEAIYDLLERAVVPCFYRRDDEGLPREWIAMMKANLATNLPRFETGRMVREYAETYYLESCRRWRKYAVGDLESARDLAAWRQRIGTGWDRIRVEDVEVDRRGEILVGGDLTVRARIDLQDLSPDDVAVELYHGPVDGNGEIRTGRVGPMELVREGRGSPCSFEGRIPCRDSGQQGFAVRVRPRRSGLGPRPEPGLITWG